MKDISPVAMLKLVRLSSTTCTTGITKVNTRNTMEGTSRSTPTMISGTE